VIHLVMDASRLSVFSALPLLPLMGLFWYLQRLARTEIGFVWGRARHYGPALLHPVLVLGLAALIALVNGAITLERTDWHKAGLNLAMVTLSTIFVATVTEEGFFRGWLWASRKRAG
jgi:membrane protease YdiL (CAAX protease family)